MGRLRNPVRAVKEPLGPAGSPAENGAAGKEGKAGKEGATGQTGYTEHLPPGNTETGRWSGVTVYPGGATVPSTTSYPIPLEDPSEEVVYLNLEEAEESAGSGECELELAEELGGQIGYPLFGSNDSPAGALVWAETSEPNGELKMHGVWAATAPEAP